MEKLELEVVAFANSESSPGNFVLILETVNSKTRLPILIGPLEAQSIAVQLEKVVMPRPLTHELFKNTLIALDAAVTEVVIHDLVDGIFIAWMILKTSAGKVIRIDARTSDAIAMAVRFNCPITAYDSIIEKAGIKDETSKQPMKNDTLESYSPDKLEVILMEATEKEDYELAARVRDIINKKKPDIKNK